jgi:hypothetical protein
VGLGFVHLSLSVLDMVVVRFLVYYPA